jgi:hypothetical protein
VRRFLFAALAAATLFALPARADSPAPGLELELGKAGPFTFVLRPAVSIGGTAYDLTHGAVLRSVSASGLLELTLIPGKLGLIAGPGFQTGDAQGLALLQGVTLPFDTALAISELVAGTQTSVSICAAKVFRF